MTNRTINFKLTLKNVSKALVGMILLALTACSSTGTTTHYRYTLRHDQPPKFRVNIKKIPNQIPRAEKLSKRGNPKSYMVMGKRYYVLRSARGYSARGTASWYGMKFHNFETANGEIYNLAAMTAAHKTLPLPTYLQVTNLRNRKKIIVKVNDRGPFVANRLIDLSYAAAKKLDMTGTGTAPVEIRAIVPGVTRLATHHSTKTLAHKANNKTYSQLGFFKTRGEAKKMVALVQRWTRLPVKIQDKIISKKRYYQVFVGDLPKLEKR